MTSEREVYVYIQLPGSLQAVPAALLRVQTLPDGTQIGRFRYGDRYLARSEAVARQLLRRRRVRNGHRIPGTGHPAGMFLRRGAAGCLMRPGPCSWECRRLGPHHFCRHPRVRTPQSGTLRPPVAESTSLCGIRSAWLRQALFCVVGSHVARSVWWRRRVEATSAGPN